MNVQRRESGVARYRQRQWYDWKTTVVGVSLLTAVVLFSVLVIEPRRGPIWAILFVAAGAWMLTTLFMRRNAYRCGKCKKVFKAPTFVNFVTPSAVGKNPDGTYYSYKNLTCTQCGARTRAQVVTRGDMKRGGGDLLDDRRLRKKS